MILIRFMMICIVFFWLFNCIVYFQVCREMPGCRRPLLAAVLWPMMELRLMIDNIYIRFVFDFEADEWRNN